jgi:hypothetical protein
MGPAVKRQENVVCLALSSPAEDEATMLAPLGRWMRFEQRDFYRVRVDNSEIVCFYDTLTAQGVYWEGTGTSAHDFDGRPTSTAPWDEHLDRLFGRDRKKQGDHSAPQSPLASSPSFLDRRSLGLSRFDADQFHPKTLAATLASPRKIGRDRVAQIISLGTIIARARDRQPST